MARAYQALAVARRASRPLDLSTLDTPRSVRQTEDDLAVASMTRALQLEPSNYIYLDYLAELRYRQGYDDALTWYERGARVLPRLKAHPYLAEPRTVPEDVAEAAVRGARAAVGTRNVILDTKILEDVAMFLAQRGRYREAAETCKQAIDLGHPEPHVLWGRRGIWLDRAGDPAGARQSLERALEIKPDYALALYGLGQIAEDQGDLQEAVRRFRAARAVNPKILRFQMALGRTLDTTGDLEEATRAYQAALRIPGGEVPASIALVDLLRRRGIYDQALVYAKRLKELHPGEETYARQVAELQAQLRF
jgi:tetratricopeptide (TPR) repeat protein